MRAQTKLEEQLNSWTHGLGAALGIVALVLLIVYSDETKPWHLFSVVVYGISIIILFLASTFYHAVKGEKRKHYFRIVDHISIYLLIAGTYTPVLLILLTDSLGWLLFWVVWGCDWVVVWLLFVCLFTNSYEKSKYKRKEAIILGFGYTFKIKNMFLDLMMNQHIPIKIKVHDSKGTSNEVKGIYGIGQFFVSLYRLI